MLLRYAPASDGGSNTMRYVLTRANPVWPVLRHAAVKYGRVVARRAVTMGPQRHKYNITVRELHGQLAVRVRVTGNNPARTALRGCRCSLHGRVPCAGL